MPCYWWIFAGEMLGAAACGLPLLVTSLKTYAGQCFLQHLNNFSGSFLLPSQTSIIIFWKTPKLTTVTQHVTIIDMRNIISVLPHISSGCTLSHGICYFLPEEHPWSLVWACLLWLYSPSVKSLLSYCFFYCFACLPSSSLWNKSKISKVSGDAWHSFLK